MLVNLLELVYTHNRDRFESFEKLCEEYNRLEQALNIIITEAGTKAQLPFNPKIRYLEYAYLNDAPQVGFESGGLIKYESFTLDASKLYNIIRKHIIEYMEDGILPKPNTMIIGRELNQALHKGELPKRFRATVMDFDLRYDSGIDGVMFL